MRTLLSLVYGPITLIRTDSALVSRGQQRAFKTETCNKANKEPDVDVRSSFRQCMMVRIPVLTAVSPIVFPSFPLVLL